MPVTPPPGGGGSSIGLLAIYITDREPCQDLIFALTQILTQNRKGADGGSGRNRAGKHPFLERTHPESAKNPPPAPLTTAHNPKVVGSNPAPATIKCLKSDDFKHFIHVFEHFAVS